MGVFLGSASEENSTLETLREHPRLPSSCLLPCPAWRRMAPAHPLSCAGGSWPCSGVEGAVSCTVKERGLGDNICLPALCLNLAGSLLHSFPLPGIDLRVRCDPRLPLARAKPAPSATTESWAGRLPLPQVQKSSALCNNMEVTWGFACSVKQVNNIESSCRLHPRGF